MNELEIIEPDAIQSLETAQISQQISTAKRYPRQLAVVKRNMMSFATLDQDTAESCFYSLPRGGKNIQGPSVRLAEIAVSCYGNIRVGSRVLSTVTTGDNPHVVVQSVCHDLETNVAVTIEKRRRITKKKFKEAIDEDDINLAGNAGAAIAFRDAVFKVIPGALIKPVFEAAQKVAIGDQKTLSARRIKCVEAFSKMGISQLRVLHHLQKTSMDEIDLGDIETLLGLHNAIKDGATNIDEAFPEIEPTISRVETPQAAPQSATAPQQQAGMEPQPTREPVSGPPATSVAEDVQKLVESAGGDFTKFQKWLTESGWHDDASSLGSYEEVPLAILGRVLKASKTFVKQMSAL